MYELYPHQKEALDKIRNGSILKGGVGSGKTLTAVAYYDQKVNPKLRVIVITTAKKRDTGDWRVEFQKADVPFQMLTVDSWANIGKYEELKGCFFVFDEQRLVGSGAWVKSFLRIVKHNRWILLSATPGDSWMDYIPVFLAHGFYKTRTEFVRQHVVFNNFVKYPKVERFLDESVLRSHREKILVEMPFERHTTRHVVDLFVEYDKELYTTVARRRWNYREGRPIRQVSELFSLLRRVVNSDATRIERIRDLLVAHPKLIIFYGFDYELEVLRGLDVKKAEWNGHKHEEIPEGDEWVYLVQYASGAEGWNCTSTDAMVFYSQTYSYRLFEQAQGRIDRLNTPFVDLWYYVLLSASPIDLGISKALEGKKNFNESEFYHKMV